MFLNDKEIIQINLFKILMICNLLLIFSKLR